MTDNTNVTTPDTTESQPRVEVFGDLNELQTSLEQPQEEVKADTPVVEETTQTVNSALRHSDDVPPPVTASVTTSSNVEPVTETVVQPVAIESNDDDDYFDTPPLTPMIKDDSNADDNDEEADETPLEEFISDEAKKSKEEGKTVETKNVIRNEMRKVYKTLNPKSDKVKKVQEALKTTTIDPNNIQIMDSDDVDPLALHSQMQLLSAVRPDPVFPIIALKSGYRADMGALTNNEKIELRNLRGSTIDQVVKLLKLVHAKIRNTSIGRMNFEKFLRVTAEEDYETLLFGIFSATFPNATEFNMNCPHCGTRINLPLYPTQLIEVIDQERAGEYVQKVLEGYNKGEQFLAESLVNTKQRILLPVGKAVVELSTPTLKSMIDNLHLSERIAEKYSADLVNITKFINKVYVPNVEALSQGQAVYSDLGDRSKYLEFLNKLAAKDLNTIRKAVSERARQYAITYRIPNFNCPSNTCAKEISNVSVDLTELIFFGIAGELIA